MTSIGQKAQQAVVVRHLDHLNMTVRNLAQSAEFYRACPGYLPPPPQDR